MFNTGCLCSRTLGDFFSFLLVLLFQKFLYLWLWGKNKSLSSHHCFIVKSATSMASRFQLFVYWKGEYLKNFLLRENTNANEGRNFKEASDLQLGPIFQLVLGLLKIHSSQSNPQQAVLTIPSQLKPLSVNTSGGVQTILMPVNKGKFSSRGCPVVVSRPVVGEVHVSVADCSPPAQPAFGCHTLPGTLSSRAAVAHLSDLVDHQLAAAALEHQL